jgi:hypothetical protein
MKDMSYSIREVEAADQLILWDILYEALWDPPSAPRRPRAVMSNRESQRMLRIGGRVAQILGFLHARMAVRLPAASGAESLFPRCKEAPFTMPRLLNWVSLYSRLFGIKVSAQPFSNGILPLPPLDSLGCH